MVTRRIGVVLAALCAACGRSAPGARGSAGADSASRGASATADARLRPATDDSVLAIVTDSTLLAIVPYSREYLDTAVKDASADSTGLATALDDFSFYLTAIDSAMTARGIRVVLRIGTDVPWRASGRSGALSFTADSGVAYVFWSRAGIRIMRGVMTDVDLLAFVDSARAAGRGP